MKFDYDRNYKPRLGASFKRRPWGSFFILDLWWWWICLYHDYEDVSL